MKYNIRYGITLWLLLLCCSMAAQEANTLSISDVSGSMGSQVALPIHLNNTCNDIVAAQFRLTLPDGLTLDTKSAQFGVRTSQHTAKVQKNGNSYVVLVYSPDNSTIAGNAGQLMTIGLNIGSGFTPGGDYALTLSEVLLSNKAGENVATDFSSGVLHIAEVTDFVVSDVLLTSDASQGPGGIVSAAWTVRNQGGLASSGGWSEQVSLVGSGRTVLLGTVRHDEVLAPGATVSRQADMQIPALPGIDGEAKVQVKLVPNADSGEMAAYQANNTTQCAQTLTLSKQLTLTVPERAEEGSKTLKCRLSRSGSWASTQTFAINADGDARLSLATNVTIYSGQASASFNLPIKDDDILNSSSTFTIQASGNGYAPVEANVELEDNEHPALTLQASKTDIAEGETFQLTVKRNSLGAEPLTVMLTCEDSKHFDFPSLITIPAGESTVSVDAKAIDDADIFDVMSLAFVASAEEHTNAEAVVVLTDNDMPQLTLQLTPGSVSESAGTNAVIGVLRREGNLDSKLVVRLSDDSNGLLTNSQRTLTLKKGERELKFGLGVKDDLLVNGDREVTVTAAVYVSSCNCYSTDQTAGSVSQKITVLDNDGPTLLVTPSASVFLEGSDDNRLTISRNAFMDEPLTVTISSNYDEALHYEHTAVIEAGQASVTVPVTVDGNNEQGDDHAFTFTVTAQGFTQGTCWSMVSDQTLPDAAISSFVVSADEAEAESRVNMAVTVKNVGNSLLRKATPVTVYFEADEVLQLSTDRILMPGEETTLEGTYALPAKTGKFNLTAIVNPSKRIGELLYTNNNSATMPINIVPCLTATAQSDKDIYLQGESIAISGKAAGTKGAYAKLEIYIVNGRTRQTVTTTTDTNGNYAVTWTPQNGLSGHFEIGACYPGEGKTETMDEFDVYGIRTSGFRAKCQFGEGDTYTGYINITNPGVLPQTGIHVEPQATSDNCEFTFTELERLEGGKSAAIKFTIKGDSVTSGYSWQQMPLVVKSKEGSSADYLILYYVDSQHGRLRAKSSSINTSVTMGTTREYPFTIQNTGKGETGPIWLSLPSWIQTATPQQMGSLASGDSATIILRITPTSDMRVNVPVTGRFGINCANGPGMSVHFNVTPVSEKQGTLSVSVVDEFTYYTSEAPRVSNAKVKIKSMTNGKTLVEGTTDEDGKFSAEMDEGWYNMTVEAENHESVTQEVMVDPGMDNKEEVYLSYDAITYEWNVVETTVQDEYSIETVVKFDTRVPQPVVVVSWPKDRPEPGSIFPVTVTNKGFINAKDVGVDLSITGNYELEFLNDPRADVLAPQQSVVFYAKVNRKDAEVKSRIITPILIDCFEVDGGAWFTYDCGPHAKKRFVEIFQQWGHCPKSHTYHGSGGSSGRSGWGSGPWHSSWNTYGYRYHQPDPAPRVICQEKDEPLKFNLQPIDAEGNNVGGNWRGIAVDGVSKLLIKLDESCKDALRFDYVYKWHLEEEIGQLKNTDAIDDVLYIPPTDFPDWINESEYTIKAILEYGQVGSSTEKTEVNIVLSRVPVVLLHGIGTNAAVWQKMTTKYLSKLYKGYQIAHPSYVSNGLYTLEDLSDVTPKAINNIKSACNKGNRIFASKVDIIAHSLGGILARRYIQSDNYRNDVHKFITVNTPHAGTPVANKLCGFYQSFLLNHYYYSKLGIWSVNLIEQLQVGSDEIKELNAKSTKGIPIHVVGSYLTANEMDSFNKLMQDYENTISDIRNNIIDNDYELYYKEEEKRFKDTFLTFLKGYPISNLITDPSKAKILFNLTAYCLSKINWINDCPLGPENDLLVNLGSQLSSSSGVVYSKEEDNHSPVIMFGGGPEATHVLTLYNDDVLQHLMNVLVESTSSGYFSTNGFSRFYYSTKKKSPSLEEHINVREESLGINLTIDGDTLLIDYTQEQEHLNNEVIVCFSDKSYIINGNRLRMEIPSRHEGSIYVSVILKVSDNEYVTDSASIDIPTAREKPVSISNVLEDVAAFLGEDPITIYVNAKWSNDDETIVSPENIISPKGLIRYDGNIMLPLKAGTDTLTFSYKGLTCTCPITIYGDDNEDMDDEETNSVCSTVSIKIEQRAVMTRQAFRGTLTVNNGHPTKAITDLKLNIEVRDAEGRLATAHEFQMEPESLNGFVGEKKFDAGWTLRGKESGTATILFIPTKYAAPTEPQEWSFGGSFSYTDPYTGLTVTRDLNPVTLTVKPTPILDFTYFMQRDVLGDDPLTADIEPMEPAEFAIIVNNKGYGSTENMKMTTNQPQIVDNEKGLAVNFEIISTQLNGQEKTLALGKSMTTDFGVIEPQSQAYAQWWLQSSLLGHFVEYDIKATHVTSHGNPDLSLLDQVTIHELIRGFTPVSVPGGLSAGRAFLVNDVEDSKDLPDEVYFTDATQQHVEVTDNLTVSKLTNTSYELRVAPTAAGWTYGSLADPTNGRAKLKSIVRQSDNATLPVDNVWQTDRTLRDGKDPLYENRLHFVGNVGATGDTFVLTFEPMPAVRLAVKSYSGVPAENTIVKEPLSELTVMFNKPIKAESFTSKDICLNCQGIALDVTQITIEQQDEQTYKLSFNSLTDDDGYYVLTVQTAGIEDAEGFMGAEGKQTAWTQFIEGRVSLNTTASPSEGGSVAPTSGRVYYGSSVALTATPAEGYEFINWICNGDNVSTEPTFETEALSDLDIIAKFRHKSYRVSIDTDGTGGTISGAGTGLYEHGTTVKLTAVPATGYVFDGWMVDGEAVAGGEVLRRKIVGETDIKAKFFPGDVNGDGMLTPADAIMILYRFFNVTQKGFIPNSADVNGDGDITPSDAIEVLYKYFSFGKMNTPRRKPEPE